MTDEELERWTSERVKAVKARIDRMPKEWAVDEFKALAAQLVLACADAGATDWPENLHLADVLEKHLMRAVVVRPVESP